MSTIHTSVVWYLDSLKDNKFFSAEAQRKLGDEGYQEILDRITKKVGAGLGKATREAFIAELKANPTVGGPVVSPPAPPRAKAVIGKRASGGDIDEVDIPF